MSISKFTEDYEAYLRIKDEGWLWKHDDMNRSVRGKPCPGAKISLRDQNAHSTARSFIRVLIEIYEEHLVQPEEFNQKGELSFRGLSRTYLRRRMKLGWVGHVTYFARKTQLGKIFETGGGYRRPYYVRIHWAELEQLLIAYFRPGTVVMADKPLSSVQSDSAAAPSALKEDKAKTSLRDVVPVLKKKVESYQDLSADAREMMDLLLEQFSPKIESIPGKTFARLQQLANDPAPRRRMTVDLLRTVLDKVNNFPDLFEDRQLHNDLDHFVRYWHTYLRVLNHAQAVAAADAAEVTGDVTRLADLVQTFKQLSPAVAIAYVKAVRDAGERSLKEIALALVQGIPVKAAVMKAREFLLARPCVYQGVYRLIGNLPDLLEISDEQHLRLVKAARSAILRADITAALEAHYA